jgi:MYXO-CTERM domain-containing protein
MGYTGHRPRLQIMQGEADTTISYKNTAESIKEWTNVLGLSTAPTSMDTGYKPATYSYDRQFWKNACGYVVFEAWSSPGGTHSMPYEEADILKFFGLDTAGGADPEPDCSGGGGDGGVRDAGGAGGAAGDAGTRDGASDAPGSGSGGAQGVGGRAGTGGTGAGTGGALEPGSGGATGIAGAGATGTGGSVMTAGTGGAGTAGATGTAGAAPNETSPGGCSCAIAGEREGAATQVSLLVLAAFGLIVRRRRA